jgi:hypothetical protein
MWGEGMKSPWKTWSFWLLGAAAAGSPALIWLLTALLIPDLSLRLAALPQPWGLVIIAGLWIFTMGIMCGVFYLWGKMSQPYTWWAANECASCGYDVRMQADGGKCPECGTIVPEKVMPGRPPKPAISATGFVAIGLALVCGMILIPVYDTTYIQNSLGGYIAGCIFVLAIWIIYWTLTRMRFRRWKERKCLYCGHDLSGDEIEYRGRYCGECGRALPAQPPEVASTVTKGENADREKSFTS